MKNNSIKIALLFAFSAIAISSYSQIAKNDVDELNTILKSSLYKSIFEIDNHGLVNRKDNNGNTFVYKISDLLIVKYDFDGFHNAIVVLKAGKKSKSLIEGKAGESDINVIAFSNKAYCDKTIEIFKKLIKSYN